MDTHGAESLMRLHLRRNDVVLGDRNDAKPQALAWIVAQGAQVIARFGWNALRWETLDGTPWNVLEAVRTVGAHAIWQWWHLTDRAGSPVGMLPVLATGIKIRPPNGGGFTRR